MAFPGLEKNANFRKKSFTAQPEPLNLAEAYQNPPPPNSMKNKLSLLVGLASLAAIVGVQAQSAVTDPVGYITLSVTGGGSPASPSLSYIGATLVNKVEFSGASATSTGTVITLPADSLTAGSFNGGAFYVEITTGPNAGVWTDIISNTANSLTVLDPIGGLASTQTIRIRRHHTISSLFGATQAANPFTGGLSIGGADELLLIDGGVPTTYYFSTDDADFDNLPDGWVTAGGTPSANVIVPPGVGIKVSRKSSTPISIVQTGYVKTGITALPIESGTNIVTIPQAAGTTLGASGLVPPLAGGLSIGGADEFLLLTTGSPTTYFFSNDDADFDNQPDGWVTAGGTPSATTLLREGSAVKITRKTAATNWFAPAQVISN